MTKSFKPDRFFVSPHGVTVGKVWVIIIRFLTGGLLLHKTIIFETKCPSKSNQCLTSFTCVNLSIPVLNQFQIEWQITDQEMEVVFCSCEQNYTSLKLWAFICEPFIQNIFVWKTKQQKWIKSGWLVHLKSSERGKFEVHYVSKLFIRPQVTTLFVKDDFKF